MKHYSMDEWKKYVNDELGQDLRVQYETHLYQCDQCLDIYLQTVAEAESILPVMSDEAEFTDSIMALITEDKQRQSKKKRFLQSPLFHYSIAAAMTLILMGTGVFQSFAQYTSELQNMEFQGKSVSMTEKIVDKTFTWMDSLEMKNKEERK
jgi:predicted anti-sigma-YlaC factor YlaD